MVIIIICENVTQKRKTKQILCVYHFAEDCLKATPVDLQGGRFEEFVTVFLFLNHQKIPTLDGQDRSRIYQELLTDSHLFYDIALIITSFDWTGSKEHGHENVQN